MKTEPKLYPDGVWARPIDKEKDVRTEGDQLKKTNGIWCRIPRVKSRTWCDELEYRRPVPAPDAHGENERRKDAGEQAWSEKAEIFPELAELTLENIWQAGFLAAAKAQTAQE